MVARCSLQCLWNQLCFVPLVPGVLRRPKAQHTCLQQDTASCSRPGVRHCHANRELLFVVSQLSPSFYMHSWHGADQRLRREPSSANAARRRPCSSRPPFLVVADICQIHSREPLPKITHAMYAYARLFATLPVVVSFLALRTICSRVIDWFTVFCFCTIHVRVPLSKGNFGSGKHADVP
uniref:Transmembrane protein n=1 Tax=Steinernema glaseri TaxID=37863 RepID=A0A1I7Y555_9BILA